MQPCRSSLIRRPQESRHRCPPPPPPTYTRTHRPPSQATPGYAYTAGGATPVAPYRSTPAPSAQNSTQPGQSRDQQEKSIFLPSHFLPHLLFSPYIILTTPPGCSSMTTSSSMPPLLVLQPQDGLYDLQGYY